jgi:hypothetical protein
LIFQVRPKICPESSHFLPHIARTLPIHCPQIGKEGGNRQKQKKRLKDGFLRHFSTAFENVRPEGFEPSTF